jgi:predicted O-methyltransferase YrrM
MDPFKKLRLEFAFSKLKRSLKRSKDEDFTPSKILELLFSNEFSLIQPWQFKGEFLNLLTQYHSSKPGFVMEIGTANGGTLFAHCKLAAKKATIISIDLPGGKFGGGYPDWKIPLYQEFARTGQHLHLIRASSHEQATLSQVKKLTGANELDYLLIDGDHTYEGVKKDYELYSPFVRKGGMIVFHDIATHPSSTCKVDVFWNEIKTTSEYKEYIDDLKQGKFGIGVLIKN